MAFAISIDIPIPTTTSSRKGRPTTYPFAELPVGGSFAAPPSDAEKISGAARVWKSRHEGWNYKTRKTAEGFRLWRTN